MTLVGWSVANKKIILFLAVETVRRSVESPSADANDFNCLDTTALKI